MRRLVLLLLLVTAPAWAGRASWKQVGGAGLDVDARARTLAGNVLVSVDGDGALHTTDLRDGERATHGGADYADTRLLFADASRLVALSDTGALYDVDLATGGWRQIGERCAWNDTVAGAMLSGQLYTVEGSGWLFVTDLSAGTWRELGDGGLVDPVALVASEDALYVLDAAGDLSRVDPATGAATRVGKHGGNPGAIAATIAGERLYTVDAAGTVRVTELGRGTVKKLAGKLTDTEALFAEDGRLIAVDAAGTVRARKR